jgi:hypothetical protein
MSDHHLYYDVRRRVNRRVYAAYPKVLPSRERNQDAKLDSFTAGLRLQDF